MHEPCHVRVRLCSGTRHARRTSCVWVVGAQRVRGSRPKVARRHARAFLRTLGSPGAWRALDRRQHCQDLRLAARVWPWQRRPWAVTGLAIGLGPDACPAFSRGRAAPTQPTTWGRCRGSTRSLVALPARIAALNGLVAKLRLGAAVSQLRTAGGVTARGQVRTPSDLGVTAGGERKEREDQKQQTAQHTNVGTTRQKSTTIVLDV
jgi:hypothetical protein